MGKYSENPIDNIQGYLENIEMVLREMQEQQRKLAEAPLSSPDNHKLETMREDVSSIRSSIAEIRKENEILSASMNTVAEAIGSVPSEEERKLQHQDDLKYIINNTKERVTVDLDPSTKAQLNEIYGGIKGFEATVKNAGAIVGKQISDNASKLSKPLDDLADTFEKRIGDFVEKKADSAANDASRARVENRIWRIVASLCAISSFLVWLIPKVKENNIGAEGFLFSVIAVLLVLYGYVGAYNWGKSKGNGWF